MKKTFYFLHGEQAAKTYFDYGVEGCVKEGHNDVTFVDYDEQTNIEDFVSEILNKVSGCLDTVIITKEEYEVLKAE